MRPSMLATAVASADIKRGPERKGKELRETHTVAVSESESRQMRGISSIQEILARLPDFARRDHLHPCPL